MTEQRQILQEKAKAVDEIESLIQKHKVIALANLQKVRAAQLQELRKKLSTDAYIRVVKNTLMRRAVAQAKNKPNLHKLEENLAGSTIFLFTDLNPFRLVLLLERSRVRITAKAGDVASFDVIVPAGSTGQPPGPIISQLGAVGLKTRIESGSVWVNKDTLVAKKGEAIPEALAAVLSKLGIKAVEAGLSLKAVYDDGVLLAEDQLRLDLDKTRSDVEEAYKAALYLSINSAYPMAENITILLRKAHQEAYSLSINEDIPTQETVPDILRKAYLHMSSLKSRLDIAKENVQKG
ncbi:MAG: 50S ribosomal protein L10 [Candidatus Bathyarchaeia archaeon]